VRALLLALMLSFIPALAACQTQAQVAPAPTVDTVFVREYSPIAGAVATTGCLGGRISQAIDMAYIGDPLWDEIVAHEAVHKRQYEGYMAGHNGACPRIEPLFLLAWEIEAYCEVRPIRLAREGWTQPATDAEYLNRMQNQFDGQLKKEHVAVLYTLGCP
jgi:hypothetical protein